MNSYPTVLFAKKIPFLILAECFIVPQVQIITKNRVHIDITFRVKQINLENLTPFVVLQIIRSFVLYRD